MKTKLALAALLVAALLAESFVITSARQAFQSALQFALVLAMKPMGFFPTWRRTLAAAALQSLIVAALTWAAPEWSIGIWLLVLVLLMATVSLIRLFVSGTGRALRQSSVDTGST